MSSIEAVPSKASVLVQSRSLHTHTQRGRGYGLPPTVTPKMKKWFWAQYYKAGDKSGGNEAEL